jgi:thiol-disulfide isomerase/thioredoxin
MRTFIFMVVLFSTTLCNAQAISYKHKTVIVGDVYTAIENVPLDKDKSYYIYVWSASCPACKRLHQLLNECTKDSLVVIGINIDDVNKFKADAFKWKNIHSKKFYSSVMPSGFIVVNNKVVKTDTYYY